jgi:hypothetical protein
MPNKIADSPTATCIHFLAIFFIESFLIQRKQIQKKGRESFTPDPALWSHFSFFYKD